ncbi:DUF1828 domain-containing protein [Deminuibacter soli]|uniref:DUF1828 domain-containing protein n=1 Tax=Deminuibacter soli TaxID=2291815 RepID=A0A3E1NCH1_9BACT|nr:DUF1828 domain-containing protein [Deminuibacter soli]RFM25705.1 DUF1828 domain-containing protein [Deminuibacter soli]
MNWINPLIDDYHNWLRSKTAVAADSGTGWAAISTPFTGLFNDLIEIYVQKNQNKITLSDNGETVHNLELTGTKLNRGERQEIANKILQTYGVFLKNDELLIEANEQNFPQRKHNFISAIIELNDMAMLSSHQVSTVFKEDVRDFLNEKQIIFTPDFISKGVTGLEFTFDFQIAHKNEEIVLKSFNSLNTMNLPSFLFSWQDIKPVRERISKKEVKAVAIINDTEKEIKPEFLEAITSKSAEFILWSGRNEQEAFDKLVA